MPYTLEEQRRDQIIYINQLKIVLGAAKSLKSNQVSLLQEILQEQIRELISTHNQYIKQRRANNEKAERLFEK